MEQRVARELRRRLLRWYGHHGASRAMPWRGTQDPYAVWVSETMLQQTRVETVIPYWSRWMVKFPDVAALANAPDEEVMAAWSGLGYYRRARNLHAAAKQVASHLAAGGGFPRTAADLQELPGVGAYTGGAVASIAFGERVPAVDGNVVRVLARLQMVRNPATPAARKRIARVAADLVDPDRPGDWNQALMDLGATLCTPRTPRCQECPIAKHCKALARGMQVTVPAMRPKRSTRVEPMLMARVARGRMILVVRPRHGILAGLWALPTAPEGADMQEHVQQTFGIGFAPDGRSGRMRHAFTHKTWDVTVVAGHASAGRLRGGARWVHPAQLQGMALSALARKAMATTLR